MSKEHFESAYQETAPWDTPARSLPSLGWRTRD